MSKNIQIAYFARLVIHACVLRSCSYHGLPYLINLWLPSMCQSEFGPATWYFLLSTFFLSNDLKAHPAGSTRMQESLTRCLVTNMFFSAKRALMELGPINRLSPATSLIFSSSSSSVIVVTVLNWTLNSLKHKDEKYKLI